MSVNFSSIPEIPEQKTPESREQTFSTVAEKNEIYLKEAEEIDIWASALLVSLNSSGNSGNTFPLIVSNTMQPSFFDPIYRIFSSISAWLSYNINPNYEKFSFPQSWEMLNSVVVHHYINYLNMKDVKFKFIEYYLLIKPEINLCLLKNINAALNYEINPPLDQPICIPIVLAGKGSFSRNHIVGLMIKDGVIEYFDSMGTPSDQIMLADNSGTLRNVLENLQAKLGYKLIEHREKLQHDIHNCAVFVCEFFRQRLKGESKMGSRMLALKYEEIHLIRERIFSDILPIIKDKTEANAKTKTEPPLYNEFDDVFDELLNAK